MKKYAQTREGCKAIGKIIADYPLCEHGICIEILETRTPLQNNALHKYFELLAAALEDGGYSIHMEFLGKSIEVPWTKESVKERIWLPAMESMTGKKHTSKLERREVSEVYDVLNRFFIEKFDIYVPFPHDEEKP